MPRDGATIELNVYNDRDADLFKPVEPRCLVFNNAAEGAQAADLKLDAIVE